MKKIIYSALLMVGLLAVVQKSEARDIFEEGVEVSTITMSTTTTFIRGPVIITGINISSNPPQLSALPYAAFAGIDISTFVTVFTSTHGATEKFRVYADTFGTTGVISTTNKEFVYPKYFPRGVIVTMRTAEATTTNVYNLVSIFYYKPRAQGQEE